MSAQISRVTVSPAADRLWPYAQPTRGIALRLVWQWIVAAADKGIAAARKRQLLLRAQRELQYLDDRMLKDIGITRSQIDSTARFGRGSRTADRLGLWS